MFEIIAIILSLGVSIFLTIYIDLPVGGIGDVVNLAGNSDCGGSHVGTPN